MPSFDIVTDAGNLVGEGLDEHAPCIRLQEGKVEKGAKKPLQLAVGESAQVAYPLLGRDLVCHVKRTE